MSAYSSTLRNSNLATGITFPERNQAVEKVMIQSLLTYDRLFFFCFKTKQVETHIGSKHPKLISSDRNIQDGQGNSVSRKYLGFQLNSESYQGISFWLSNYSTGFHKDSEESEILGTNHL